MHSSIEKAGWGLFIWENYKSVYVLGLNNHQYYYEQKKWSELVILGLFDPKKTILGIIHVDKYYNTVSVAMKKK